MQFDLIKAISNNAMKAITKQKKKLEKRNSSCNALKKKCFRYVEHEAKWIAGMCRKLKPYI